MKTNLALVLSAMLSVLSDARLRSASAGWSLTAGDAACCESCRRRSRRRSRRRRLQLRMRTARSPRLSFSHSLSKRLPKPHETSSWAKSARAKRIPPCSSDAPKSWPQLRRPLQRRRRRSTTTSSTRPTLRCSTEADYSRCMRLSQCLIRVQTPLPAASPCCIFCSFAYNKRPSS
jgi:hypothetical protein